jgi:raffinose/stachyose/melibiose transport system permease protein
MRRASTTPYLYVLPSLILVVGIIYLGIGYTGWTSTLDWNGIDPDPEQIGFGNFTAIAADGRFWSTIAHMAVFGSITIVVQMAIGLVMAILLSNPAVRARGLLKIVIFLPVVLAPAVIATAFRQLFAADGAVNQILEAVGFGALAQPWLADPDLALGALIVIQIWEWTGFSFLLYLAAISQVDPHLFEAAQIDGAGSGQILWRVLIPQLTGTHATLVLLGTIGLLKTFDVVYLTTGGGPAGATEFLTTYIYRHAINQFNTGYAAALSMVLLVLSLALTVLQMRANRIKE